MYEMFSGGKKPFDNIPNEDFASYLETGGRPKLPIETPEQM